jgi:GT2 family glycosyltransferase
MLSSESLYAVTVNWNLAPDTIRCVDSLVAAGAPPNHIIVVDNGSTDDSVQSIQAALGPELHILRSATNRGYAAGVNMGARQAFTLGADSVFLLNNDTQVAHTFLRDLERAAAGTQPGAILAPLIFYMDDRDRIWRCGDRLVRGTLFTRSLYHNQRLGPTLPTVVPVDFVTGCGMLVPRRVFESVGPFDESLFMYGEEVDYCWRARLAGYSLACLTTAHMWHKVSASSDRDRPRARYLRVQNQNRFYRTYARGWQRPLMFGLSAAHILVTLMRDVTLGQRQLVAPTMSGWWHGWTRWPWPA